MKINKFQLFFLFFLFLALFLLFRDSQQAWQIISDIQYWLIVIAVLFSCADVCFDFYSWYYYLKVSDKLLFQNNLCADSQRLKKSFLIFLAGFATDLLPAKMGTFSRPILLKKIQHLPLRFGAAIQFNALFADFSAAALIAVVGLILLNYEFSVLMLTILFTLFMLGFFIFVFKFSLMQAIIQRLIRPFFPPEAAFGIADLQQATMKLLHPKHLIITINTKLFSWACMGISLYLILHSIGYDLHWSETIFIVTISAIVGVISMLPGGLGVTDASLVGFLVFMDIPTDIAVFVVFIYRLISFWSWVLIGNVSGQYLLGTVREKNG